MTIAGATELVGIMVVAHDGADETICSFPSKFSPTNDVVSGFDATTLDGALEVVSNDFRSGSVTSSTVVVSAVMSSIKDRS